MSKKPELKTASRVRCAIYTRKSTEEGLDQAFNSLDAQRESAEAYIASQKSEGWTCVPDRYDDGGFTGGNMERPAVKRLMADIEAGLIDCVVVYKVDRLSRSLMDFARLMELFERKRISFVSVTQQFNTTQSMGRLTLNILLSFAQFEREIISERTRDKIAAVRRKGKWSGGRTILGYDVEPSSRRLIVNPAEAEIVRSMFMSYLEKNSLLEVCKQLNRDSIKTKEVQTRHGKAYGGRVWDKAAVFKVLTNVLYRGLVKYKTETYPGEHEAIIDADTWAKTQETLQSNGRTGGMHQRNKYGALLKGLIHCGPCNMSMGHTITSGRSMRFYRYYVCYRAQKQGWDSCPCKSVPAEQIENFVVEQVKRIGTDPDLRARTLAKCREQSDQRLLDARGELKQVERELARLQSDLSETARSAAASPHAASHLADLHERSRTVNERAEELRTEVADLERSQLSKDEVDAALAQFEGVWKTLSPKEQARLLRMLIKRVDYDATKGTVSITFHPLGLRSINQNTDLEAA